MRKLLVSKQFLGVLAALLLLSIVIVGAVKVVHAKAPNTISTSYITISVDPSGLYSIVAQTPAWTFGGNIGQTLSNITSTTGSDGIGSYQEIDFNYTDRTGAARGGGMRTYNTQATVLFIDSYFSANNNTSPFPTLNTYPKNLNHLAYVFAFSQPSFTKYGADSPWLYFDGSDNAFILSPASDFMLGNTVLHKDNSISSGITPVITTLPQGLTHKTMLVVGHGINSTYQTWGQAMTSLSGKVRPANDADPTLNKLGYWTDHGSSYYYTYDPNLGYAGTLLAVKQSFQQEGIPLGYMQLDSWWYPKGSKVIWSDHNGGIYTYTADPTLFPNGLSAFQQQLGLPLITHSRWIDTSSPYRQEFQMSNNVSIDPRFWSQISDYIKGANTIMYEQDWLATRALPATNLTDPNAFMDNMASGMAANGITMQYCTEFPRHLLQSTLYNNLTTARVSGDQFTSSVWDKFLYTSRFASALGVWPWSDVFMSTQTDNLLLSTLSAGIVGVGDAIGAESKSNLFQTIRADGVIVKPDASIVPIDDMYLHDAQNTNSPMIAATHSQFSDGMKALYVFAYARGGSTKATFNPAVMGIPGDAYVYNYFTGIGTVVPAGHSFSDNVTSGSYYIVVPIGQSGIGFLGDAGKFVSWGKKRFTQLSDTGSVQATMIFAQGETSLTVYGYSPKQSTVTASNGSVGPVNYNSATGLFNVAVSPGSGGGSATINVSSM